MCCVSGTRERIIEVSGGDKDIARREAKTRRQDAHAALGADAAFLFSRVFAKAGLATPGAVIAGYMPKSSEADPRDIRSEEHTSELQSLMRNSYAVFCLKTKTTDHRTQ